MAKLIKKDNGLRIFYQRHTGSMAFALGVFVAAGCVYESKKNNGIAHFIEHMVFKGTETRTAFDIADESERCGIMMNAFTSRHYTAFYTIGLREYADKCADLLSDMYFNATFTEENLTLEKDVVIEEIKMYEDDNEDVCLENLIKAHYGNVALSSPILGSKKNVRAFTKEDIKKFMNALYRPENTCIAVVGDISEEEAVSLVDKYFAFPETSDRFVKPKSPYYPPLANSVKKVKKRAQAAVGISFPSYPHKHENHYAPGFIASILGGGMSSRLFQEIREKSGLVYEIYATNNQYEDNGYFVIYFGSSPDKVRTAVKKIRECLVDVIEKGFTQEEFDKAMAQLKTGAAMSGESASEIMRLGGRYGLADQLVTYDSMLQELKNVTLKDINGAIKDIFDFDKMAVSYVGQKLDFDLKALLRGEE